MKAKDFRTVLLYMCNHWGKEEAERIYNTKNDGSTYDWRFSLGEHIWLKWIDACEHHGGALDGIAWFLTELDNENLQKLIDRAFEYYKS
jgi:hypothetical protein